MQSWLSWQSLSKIVWTNIISLLLNVSLSFHGATCEDHRKGQRSACHEEHLMTSKMSLPESLLWDMGSNKKWKVFFVAKLLVKVIGWPQAWRRTLNYESDREVKNGRNMMGFVERPNYTQKTLNFRQRQKLFRNREDGLFFWKFSKMMTFFTPISIIFKPTLNIAPKPRTSCTEKRSWNSKHCELPSG